MTELSSAALLSDRHGAPIWLFERSAAARAKASQATVESVLDDWVEGAAGPAEDDRQQTTDNSPTEDDRQQTTDNGPTEGAASRTVPPTEGRGDAEERSDDAGGLRPSSPSKGGADEGGGGGQTLTGAALLAAVAEARGLPESLIERSAGARASAAGVDLEDVLHEWAQEEGLEAPSQVEVPRRRPPAASPKDAASPKEPAAPPVAAGSSSSPLGGGADEGGGGGQALTGAALLTAVAAARRMPESLVERSAAARAKKTDATVEDVLNEWAEEAGLVATSSQLPAAGPKAAPVAAGLTGAALLTAVAEARGMPESLVERSAKARAKKTDRTVEDVLNEWAQEAGLGAASPEEAASSQLPDPSPKAEPQAAEDSSSSPSGGGADEGGGGGQALMGAALLTAVAEARGMPESLVERSAKARAKKTDGTVEDVLNEWAEEAGLVAASPEEAASPEVATSSQPPAASPTATAATTALSGAALLTAVAEARGMPESLVERSAKARAKKTDTSLEDVLNEWAEEAGLVATSSQPPAASPKAAPAAAGLTGAALLTAVAAARGMPESLVERSAKARAKKTDGTVEDVLNEWAEDEGLMAAGDQPPPASEAETADDQPPATSPTEDAGVQAPDTKPESVPGRVRTWRHALAIGAIAALVPLIVLIVLAVVVDVPSELSEAPWYLVGLEPFLTYLDPFTAVIIIPGVVFASIVILAFVAWSPAVHPSLRRLAVMVLAILLLAIALLTIVGALVS